MNPIPPKKKNKSLTLVKPIPLSGLDKFKRLSRAEEELDEELLKFGDLTKFQDGECQIIHQICNLVENLSSVKLSGQEKKDFVIKKITSLLPVMNNDNDLKWINKTIDMLCLVGAVSKIAQSKEMQQSVKSMCGFFSK